MKLKKKTTRKFFRGYISVTQKEIGVSCMQPRQRTTQRNLKRKTNNILHCQKNFTSILSTYVKYSHDACAFSLSYSLMRTFGIQKKRRKILVRVDKRKIPIYEQEYKIVSIKLIYLQIMCYSCILRRHQQQQQQQHFSRFRFSFFCCRRPETRTTGSQKYFIFSVLHTFVFSALCLPFSLSLFSLQKHQQSDQI